MDQITLKDIKYLKQIQEFVKGLQKGDLVLDQFIEYGIGLYGQSKTGKTSTSHLLAGYALSGISQNGTNMLQATSRKYKQARIGNTNNSQTDIPNIFKTLIDKREISILDTPGYGDTLGVLRIFANAFYHYRLYSKVQNMKFIICFDYSQLSNTAQKVIDTIQQFTSYFKDYYKNKQQIWQSCCFLITKIPQQNQQIATQNMKNKLISLSKDLRTQMLQQQDKIFRQFLNFIVNNDRVFTILEAKNEMVMECKGLLQRINSKVNTWWKRQIKNDSVDLSPISFTLAKQIHIATTKTKKAQQQFIQLIQYYNIRINEILKIDLQENAQQADSLGQVINQLVSDIMGSPESHNFIKKMKSFINKNYYKYDQTQIYTNLRQKKQNQIFRKQENLISQTIIGAQKNQKDKNYVIKKFKAIKRIQQLKKYANTQIKKTSQKSIQILNRFQETLYDIIRQFNLVRFKKNNSLTAIYKYGYLIHRIIEQSKIFYLLIEINAGEQLRKKLITLTKNKGYVIQTLLIGFMGVDFYYDQNDNHSYQSLHKLYVKNFKIDEQILKKININSQFLSFFTQQIQMDQNITRIYNSLILNYSDRIIKESQQNFIFSLQQKKFLIKKLTQSRLSSEVLVNQAKDPDLQFDELISLRKITQNLAKLLEMTRMYDLAKEVYQSIKFVDNVCKIYQKLIQQKPLDVKVRIQYSKYLAEHFRQNDAIKVLQSCYQKVKQKQHLEVVGAQLVELRVKIRNLNQPGNNSEYEQQLYDSRHYSFFGDLYKKILEYANDQQNMNQ